MFDRKVQVQRFDSIREFADAAVAGYEAVCADRGWTPKPNGHRKSGGYGGRDHASSNTVMRDDPGWHGVTRSIYEARDLAVNGWKEGGSAITANLDKIMPRLKDYVDTMPESIPQVYGDVWDLQEYLNGNPEYAWEEIPTEEVRKGNVITVLVNFTASWNVSAETLAYRGSLLMGVMEILQLLGFEMEVWTESVIEAWGEYVPAKCMLTRVKAAGDLMDVQSYSFVTEPGWFRRLTFGVMEGWENRHDYGVPDGGYGHVGDMYATKLVGANLAVHLGGNQDWPHYNNGDLDEGSPRRDMVLADAEAWVKRTVESIESQTVVGSGSL